MLHDGTSKTGGEEERGIKEKGGLKRNIVREG